MQLLIRKLRSFIRLRRVLLLCSDIRLSPSGIRYASFMANKISLKPEGFNSTIAIAIISLRRSRNITLAFSADLCYTGANEKPLPSGEVAAKPTERAQLCAKKPLTRYRGSSPKGRAVWACFFALSMISLG